jgi:outer membrane lipoprotein-sorting protein
MRTLTFIFLFAFTSLLAQDKDKSESLLSDLSKKIKSYTSFSIEFKASIKNADTGIDETVQGQGWVQGDKFHTIYGDNIVISNGIKIWVVSKEDKAVYISSASDDDDESLNPKKLMSIWENGFKSKYVKEENGNHIINLYPKEPGKSQYHTLVIKINASTKELKSVEVRMKDGTKMVYDVTKLVANIDIPSTKFVYDKRNFAGYQEVDN